MWQAPLRRTWWAGTVAALAWLALPGPVFADQAVPAKPVAAAPPAATPMTTPDTDQPIWRAMHRLLVGITRAGDRLVAVGNAGAILLSDDGGDSWRAARTPTDELLTAVLFPAPSEGWAVGQDGLVLHSTDAGVTWSQQHIAAGSDQALFSIAAVTPPHLIATGAYDLVLETQDGISWQDGKIPDLDDDYHLNCAVARGDDVLVTGESGHAFVRHAGTWSPMTLPYDGSQFACLLGRDGSFYSFGLRGSAFRIQPGSALWARIDLGGQQSIFGATMLADGRIALVGSNGVVRLLDPNNGGVTTLPAVGETTLSGVAEGKPGHLVAVGEDGVHVIDISASSAEARP
jgi:photosystem II stability/assembly factor-like uncharacterized protein